MSYSEQVLQAIEQGNLEKLPKLLNLALHNDSKDYLNSLYNELFYLGFLNEAKEVAMYLKGKEKNNLQYNLYLAEIAIEDDDLDTALTLLEEIPKDSEFYIESLIITADIYQILGIPEVSLHKLEEAIKIDPNEPVLQFAVAELYFSIGEYENALPKYQELLKNGHQNISNISISERVGISLSILGYFEEAVPYLEESLKEYKGDDQLFYLGYTYLQLNENEKAIKLLSELIDLNDTYQSAYVYLAEALKEENRLDEALEIAKKGIKIDTYQSKLYQVASEIMYLKHDTKEAEKYLLQAIDYDQGETSRQALANLYVTEQRYTEAIKLIEKMQDVDSMAKWTLAQSYRGLENDEKAIKFYKEASIELHHDLEFMRDYGLYLREIGQIEESKHYLEHYLEHVPDDLEIADIIVDLNFNF